MTPSLLNRILTATAFACLISIPTRPIAAQAQPTPSSSSRNASGRDVSTPEDQSPAKQMEEEDENAAYRKSPAVRALGAKLGLNPDQSATAFEVLNFAILAILLGWLLARMLPKTFRDRNTAIQKHLVDARTATEEASARLGNVEARLARLDDQIAEIRSQSEKDSALDEQRIKAAAEDEKQKILASAEQEIAAATIQARRELQRYAAELAIEQAGRKLVITAETDRLLVQGFVARLGSEDGNRNDKGGQN